MLMSGKIVDAGGGLDRRRRPQLACGACPSLTCPGGQLLTNTTDRRRRVGLVLLAPGEVGLYHDIAYCVMEVPSWRYRQRKGTG